VQPLLGVISGPIPPYNSNAPDITEELQDIGITSIRNNDYYNDALDMEGMFGCSGCSTYPCWSCDPKDPLNYNWTLSDELFQSYVDGGFEPFFRIGGEYQCEIRNHDYKGPRDYEEDNYIRAAKKVVERYLHWNGSQGTFSYLDLWTEYPNSTFWDRSNDEFKVFWGKLYDTLKTVYPELKVGGPGLLFTLFIAKGQTDNPKVQETIDFLTYLYEQNIKPDWISWHLFHLEPADYYNGGKNMRHLLDGTDLFSFVPWAGTGFFENTELICDAYYLGKIRVDSLGENPQVLPAAMVRKYFNRQEGSATLSAVWMNLQMTDIKRAYYYRANDPASEPDPLSRDSSDALFSGLFFGDSNGSYKPVAYAFKLFSRLYNNYPYLLSTDGFSEIGITDSLWILAAENREGKYAVLVSNVDFDDNLSFRLKINNEVVDTNQYVLKFRTVNNNENGETLHDQYSPNFKINSMNVMLIELEKKSVLSVGQELSEPAVIKLKQNYPNPFSKGAGGNSSTTIEFSLAKTSFVSVKIFNMLGQEIKTLVNSELSAGTFEIVWDGKDFAGNAAASGAYFYRISDGKNFITKKMLLMR